VNVGETQIVIGKRVPIGAMVNSLGVVFAALYPDYSTAIMGSAVAVTFFVQVAVAHFSSITTKE
jgi:hypothetical protein